jgi:hypothetical protein
LQTTQLLRLIPGRPAVEQIERLVPGYAELLAEETHGLRLLLLGNERIQTGDPRALCDQVNVGQKAP